MVKPELGTKRTCPNCATRFYDLLKDPITCPKCSTSFVAMQILPSKTEIPGMAQQAAPKPREVEAGEDQEAGDIELVSLEDVEAEEKGDDETAGIEDVDLGEEGGESNEDEDDTFLVEEEDDGNMGDLVEGGGKEEEEEQ
ncbi:MAG: TIGR02300 family protein [Alphaproteobacteria bacterium]|nr:TIGR02300 family protein [Alphaproteobacteria bacterium]